MADFETAQALLARFKGPGYIHGLDVLAQAGQATAVLGTRAVLVRGSFSGSDVLVETVRAALAGVDVELLGELKGARPNAPAEDVARISAELARLDPGVIVSLGGGSTIDAVKAAEVLRTLGGRIGDYFGTGLVTSALERAGKTLTPHVAIQSAASSGAHLTKYANVTDLETQQKKLIVDEAIVPVQPIFDYRVTFGAPAALTSDGALDGMAHCLEVLYGAAGKSSYAQVEEVARTGIGLAVEALPVVLANPHDALGREALGLATDLGGYAIMIGGTNGGHLTSFSLVDVLSHGRACAIMNPYYTVFFAPAIQEPLRVVGKIFKKAGYTDADLDRLTGRTLGVAVAEALIAFEKRIGFPTTLAEVPGFSDAHIARALAAAKDPQLRMKLENMPVPLTAARIDDTMGSVLRAAKTGDLGLIKNV
jgi:alcohol dehydrogenase